MKTGTRVILAATLSIGIVQLIATPRTYAQSSGPIGSLGGYGGSMTEAGSGMEMSTPAIPYAGKFGGFMPYRMGGGGSLTFQSRGTSAIGSPRAPFSLSSMSGGMGRGLGSGPSMFSLSGSSGAMSSSRGMAPMFGTRGMGVMPPSFGSPFRQPPSLLGPASPGMGMSM